MEHVNIIGYYKEVGTDETDEKLLYFVAYENELNYSQNNKINGKTWLEGFNVIDGHFQLKDRNYLTKCKKITKVEYKAATKGLYTPIEYLL